MQVTEVRLKAPEDGEGRVVAYVSIVLDGELLVHDFRLVEGPNGIFLAMPDKEVWVPCEWCKKKSPYRAKFCMHCGQKKSPGERHSLRFIDLVQPLTRDLRLSIDQAVLDAHERGKSA